jgi:hypothetical protein
MVSSVGVSGVPISTLEQGRASAGLSWWWPRTPNFLGLSRNNARIASYFKRLLPSFSPATLYRNACSASHLRYSLSFFTDASPTFHAGERTSQFFRRMVQVILYSFLLGICTVYLITMKLSLEQILQKCYDDDAGSGQWGGNVTTNSTNNNGAYCEIQACSRNGVVSLPDTVRAAHHLDPTCFAPHLVFLLIHRGFCYAQSQHCAIPHHHPVLGLALPDGCDTVPLYPLSVSGAGAMAHVCGCRHHHGCQRCHHHSVRTGGATKNECSVLQAF